MKDLINFLDSNWQIESITSSNLNCVFELFCSNEPYFSSIGQFPVTKEDCNTALEALPPNTSKSQKHFFLFYYQSQPMAVVDFIVGYPTAQHGYIGLLLVNKKFHHQGFGQTIFHALCHWAKSQNCSKLQLGCYEMNKIGFSFWQKNGFVPIKTISTTEKDGNSYQLISMECNI